MAVDMPIYGTYRASAVLSGTIETLLGGTIDVADKSTLALFFKYGAGTEGTVTIVPYFRPKLAGAGSGANFQWQTFAAAAGAKAATTNSLTLGGTGNYYYQFDVRGLEAFVLYSDVAGTVISGTLEVTYALTDR